MGGVGTKAQADRRHHGAEPVAHLAREEEPAASLWGHHGVAVPQGRGATGCLSARAGGSLDRRSPGWPPAVALGRDGPALLPAAINHNAPVAHASAPKLSKAQAVALQAGRAQNYLNRARPRWRDTEPGRRLGSGETRYLARPWQPRGAPDGDGPSRRGAGGAAAPPSGRGCRRRRGDSCSRGGTAPRWSCDRDRA